MANIKTVSGALDALNTKLGGTSGDISAAASKEAALETVYHTLGGQKALEGVNSTAEIIEEIASLDLSGGGGSSDFSTATLRIIGAQGISVEFCVPRIYDSESFENSNPSFRPHTSDESITVILYKGKAAGWFADATIEATTEGDVEFDDDAYIITGDCTITITPR